MLASSLERVATCHKCSSAGGTLWLSVVLFQDDSVLCKIFNVWRLNGWVVPGDIVEPEIVCENENNVGLSVVLGPPLLLGEATVAEECHQEGDQHSSSQLILLLAGLVR